MVLGGSDGQPSIICRSFDLAIIIYNMVNIPVTPLGRKADAQLTGFFLFPYKVATHVTTHVAKMGRKLI